jgi:sulfide dehydrogenase cytochrome subunit
MRLNGFVLTAAALLCWQGAQAQPGAPTKADMDAGRRLYATCAACHGTDGKPVAGSSLPPLAGQPREILASSMKAFREGSRPATIMHQIAKGYTSEQIELIAAYLAAPANSERP